MADIRIYAADIEEAALAQIDRLAALPPFASATIRIMPDAHAGAGCVIGFTSNVTDAVIPNIVGVDIGCGVLAVRLDAEPGEALARALDAAAHEAVPTGFEVHDHATLDAARLDAFECARGFSSRPRLLGSLGTLGGGNHFIECDVDGGGAPWLVVHSGSRNIGKQVADLYQAMAVGDLLGTGRDARDALIASLKDQGREREIARELKRLRDGAASDGVPDDLCWLEGASRDAYLHDMGLCQRIARENRALIAEEVLDAAGIAEAGERIESVHNYIDLEHGVTRKGAIAAYAGQRVVIPLNMAAGCIVGTGLGNVQWNCSAPHGAGRRMSRAAARRSVSLGEYAGAMEGIYSTTVCEGTLDESPQAYKDPEGIAASLAPTVAIEATMRPIWNFKAVGERIDWKAMRGRR